MKTFFFAAASLVASSLLSPGTAGSAPVKFNVSLDGFCEIFELDEISDWNSPVAGTLSGCDKKSNVIGSVAPIAGATYIIANFTQPHTKNAFTIYFSAPKHGTGNWVWYLSSGKSYQQVTSGTYSKLTPEGKAMHPGEQSALYGHNQ